jgi:WD40 repeat protein
LKELDSNKNTEWKTTLVREKDTTPTTTPATTTTTTTTIITTTTTTTTIMTTITTITTTTTTTINTTTPTTTTITTTTTTISTTTTEICNNHGSSVFSLSFNSHGLLASGSCDGTIKLWEKESIRCIKTLCGHELIVFSLAFNNNGLLASGSFDHKVKLWDTTTGECIRNLTEHSDIVTSVAFNSDGLLVSGSVDRTIKLWNTTTGVCKTLSTESGVFSIAFISEIQIAYSTTEYNQLAIGIYIRNIKNTELESKKVTPYFDELFYCVTFKNGFLAGPNGHEVILWDEDFQLLPLAFSSYASKHTKDVNSVAFNNNGLLASGSDDRTIKIWNTTTRELMLVNTLKGHTAGVLVVAFNWDGLLASGSVDGTIKLWNTSTANCVKTFGQY